MSYTTKQLARALVDLVEEGKEVGKVTDAMVDLLSQNKELHRVRGVMEVMEQVWKEKYGVATIVIETTHPLSSAMKKKVMEMGRGAEVREIVDSTMIGGARLRIDDRVIDATILGRLEQLKEHLKS